MRNVISLQAFPRTWSIRDYDRERVPRTGPRVCAEGAVRPILPLSKSSRSNSPPIFRAVCNGRPEPPGHICPLAILSRRGRGPCLPSKDVEHQGLRSGEPAKCLNPESLVARPSDEGVWQPMRHQIQQRHQNERKGRVLGIAKGDRERDAGGHYGQLFVASSRVRQTLLPIHLASLQMGEHGQFRPVFRCDFPRAELRKRVLTPLRATTTGWSSAVCYSTPLAS